MTEFAHAGDESEPEHSGFFFDHRIKNLECRQKIGDIFLRNVIENGLVIFVQQKNDIAVAVMQRLNQSVKHGIGGCFRQFYAFDPGLFLEDLPETLLHFVHRAEIPSVHIQMNDRMRLPAIRFIIDRQSLEQLFFSLEDSFQRGKSQRFAETARTGQKIHFFGRFYQLPNIVCFVHIQKIALSQIFKTVNAAGDILHQFVSLDLSRTIHRFFLLSSCYFCPLYLFPQPSPEACLMLRQHVRMVMPQWFIQPRSGTISLRNRRNWFR